MAIYKVRLLMVMASPFGAHWSTATQKRGSHDHVFAIAHDRQCWPVGFLMSMLRS
jgi:hypothetical protein